MINCQKKICLLLVLNRSAAEVERLGFRAGGRGRRRKGDSQWYARKRREEWKRGHNGHPGPSAESPETCLCC